MAMKIQVEKNIVLFFPEKTLSRLFCGGGAHRRVEEKRLETLADVASPRPSMKPLRENQIKRSRLEKMTAPPPSFFPFSDFASFIDPRD